MLVIEAPQPGQLTVAVQSVVGETKVIERREETTQSGVDPAQSVFAEPQYTQRAIERGESPQVDLRQPAVVKVQPEDGQVGERTSAVERQALVAVEEQLVKMKSGKGAVTQRCQAVVTEIQPAQVNKVDKRTCLDLRYCTVTHVQMFKSRDPLH